jgi:hypothetical protein
MSKKRKTRVYLKEPKCESEFQKSSFRKRNRKE